MTDRDSHQPGTPSWVDLSSPDPDASAAFYSALFGWQVEDPAGPEAGYYRMAKLRGRAAAGIGPVQAEGAPPWWTTYVSVQDADATAKAVEQAGGKVLMPPTDVLTFGRMAVFTDPGGAVIAAWQPGQQIGAEVVNEPGALAWAELMTHDLDAAKRFYDKVFGWQAEQVDMGQGDTYTLWTLPGRQEQQGSVGGAVAMVGDMWPADLPDHWMVYFEVEDCDTSAARVSELGGKVSVPPTSIPGVGRFSVVNGPHGEVFSIITSEPPPTPGG